MQKRGAVDVANLAGFIDQKHTQDMRHGAHVFAILVIVPDHPLPIGVEDGVQCGGALCGEELPVKIPRAKLRSIRVNNIGGIEHGVKAETHQARLIRSGGVCLQGILDAPHHVGGQRAAVHVIAGGENKAQDSGLVAQEIMELC